MRPQYTIWPMTFHPPSSSSVSLIYSTGVEILLKVRLERENWPLVFANPCEANRGDLKTGDFRSVGIQGAVARLESDCDVQIQEEHKQALYLVRKERNKIIHIGYMGNPLQLRPVAAKTLAFSISFISDQLEPSGLTEGTGNLLDEIRSGLTRIQNFVTERRREVRPILAASYTPIVQCPRCLEEAMTFDDGRAKCEFCGLTDDGESTADLYAHNVLELSKYRIVKHGGEWPSSSVSRMWTQCVRGRCGGHDFALLPAGYASLAAWKPITTKSGLVFAATSQSFQLKGRMHSAIRAAIHSKDELVVGTYGEVHSWPEGEPSFVDYSKRLVLRIGPVKVLCQTSQRLQPPYSPIKTACTYPVSAPTPSPPPPVAHATASCTVESTPRSACWAPSPGRR